LTASSSKKRLLVNNKRKLLSNESRSLISSRISKRLSNMLQLLLIFYLPQKKYSMDKLKELLDSGIITIDDLIEYLNSSHYEVLDLWDE